MPQFTENINRPAIYFKTLYMMNVRCFKGEHSVYFNNSDGKIAAFVGVFTVPWPVSSQDTAQACLLDSSYFGMTKSIKK